MTDETTARDRAIEWLALRIEAQAALVDRLDQRGELDRLADEVRALAGAPTADEFPYVTDVPNEAIDSWGPQQPTPTADVAAMEETIEILSDPDTMDAIRGAQMEDAATGVDLRALLTAAPEGVDAADERENHCGSCSQHVLVDRLTDELTAAQAAIQRVRHLHRRHDDDPGGPPYCAECTSEYAPWPCPTVRALDGDTTEEGR